MIDQVLHPYNLQKALYHVIQNKGSAGVDGVPTKVLMTYFHDNRQTLIEQIKQGNYLAQPILGVELSEANHEYL